MPVYGLVECVPGTCTAITFVDCILSVNACYIHCFFEQILSDYQTYV